MDWINAADPYSDDPGLTLEYINEERTVYLIHEGHAESDEAVRAWVKRNYQTLFESELAGWYTDEQLWPKNRNLKLFDEWFEVQCHTVLIEMASDPLFDDDL